MKLKFIQDEDFSNYKKCSMFIGTPFCDFKCEKDCGIKCCQNSALVKAPTIDIPAQAIVDRYLKNPFTSALVIGGMEPFKSFDEVLELVKVFRDKTDDPIIIYTGYREDEIATELAILKQFPEILVKFGRFCPNAKHKFDELLGVELASDNQFAKKIS